MISFVSLPIFVSVPSWREIGILPETVEEKNRCSFFKEKQWTKFGRKMKQKQLFVSRKKAGTVQRETRRDNLLLQAKSSLSTFRKRQGMEKNL